VIAILAAGVLSPFFFEATPEVRSTYQSLGKIVEDRPMQIMFVRAGYDADEFGRFGIRNWDVSSLTDRRHDAHRHALYHTEFGPFWHYSLALAEGWRLKSDLTRSWTLYRGFENRASNRTYHWWQIDQSLENPYVVPFYRLRKCFRGSDYIYFKAGLRKRFKFLDDFYLTPSVFAEGGSSRNQKRVFGAKRGGGEWRDGVSSVSFRLELGWKISDCLTAFAFVEQYEVVGGDARRTNGASSYRCAHNDWTLGGIGLRMSY
jgi:hypothetical protein